MQSIFPLWDQWFCLFVWFFAHDPLLNKLNFCTWSILECVCLIMRSAMTVLLFPWQHMSKDNPKGTENTMSGSSLHASNQVLTNQRCWSIILPRPVTLILTSRQRSCVTGTVDLLVTTPLLTVFGLTVAEVLVVPESVLVLLGQRCRGSVLLDAFSTGNRRKSRTSWSQSKMRKTLRLLRTTVKQEESRVDLQRGETAYETSSFLLNTIADLSFYIPLKNPVIPIM